jgi:hypothetical protein
VRAGRAEVEPVPEGSPPIEAESMPVDFDVLQPEPA